MTPIRISIAASIVAVTVYVIFNIAMRGVAHAYGMSGQAVEALAWACPVVPFTAVFPLMFYRVIPFMARNLRMTSRPEDYESELRARPEIHHWQQTVKVHITDDQVKNAVAIYQPPIPYDDMRRVALAIKDGARFSYPGLVTPGVISREQFRSLRSWAIARHWAVRGRTLNSGAALTRPGLAAMRAIADCPAPLPSMQV